MSERLESARYKIELLKTTVHEGVFASTINEFIERDADYIFKQAEKAERYEGAFKDLYNINTDMLVAKYADWQDVQEEAFEDAHQKLDYLIDKLNSIGG
ncbi:hypothetical protein [Natribacillus halophilus]|uniref:Uncharacterized protein n=1 Tax=Natribacillus halophilus TaxID=549003 RepID=A0A1G8RTE7_9BACI|nr:hypothetical protein [Natribacillus halophilus]SDJ20344.1 hypothetical protein SAMN04488123_12041 [Natribacillus halophilus]